MNEFDRFIQAGEHLLELKRPTEALEQFEKALSIAPEDSVALLSIARAFSMLKQADRAMEYVTRGVAASPNDEWGFRVKAHVHLLKDQRSSAYKAATRAVQLDPENIEAVWMLTCCALSLERREEAKMLGEMLVKLAPESTYGHHALGEVAHSRERLPEAAQHFERVLQLDPNNVNALESLANIRNAHNKFGESVDLLRGAMSVDPTREDRQSNFKDSMKRFALFGQAHERRKSVAGLMVTIFIAYLALGIVLRRFIGPTDWFQQVFLSGLVVVMAVGIPFLRSRFFAAQSQQLHLLYENMSRQTRRRTLLAALVLLATAYGIAGIVYLDVGDKWVFLAPPVFLVQAFWLYMLAITVRLVTLWMSDTWTRMMGKDVPTDHRGIPLTMIALPAVTVIAFGISLWNGNNLAEFIFLAGWVVSAIIYFKRYPVGTGLFFIALGLAILAFEVVTQPETDDLTLGELGIVVAAVGLCVLAVRGYNELRRYWQRRRVSRLLVAEPAD